MAITQPKMRIFGRNKVENGVEYRGLVGKEEKS